MFENDGRQQILADLRRRMSGSAPVAAPLIAPVVGSVVTALSESPVIAVPEPLADILPRGGLVRGSVVSLAGGSGSTSLLLSLLAAPANAWSALVGMPDIGLLAASELGVDLNRVVVIPNPGPDVLQVLSILADGVDMVGVAGPVPGATPARLRVLGARLRQSGAVLLVAGPWPGADLVLDCRMQGWTGTGQGSGRLRDRQLVVGVRGRGAAGHRQSVVMLLQSTRSTVALSSTTSRPVLLPQPVADVG